jgi:uroporphyrinogen decarboxylase
MNSRERMLAAIARQPVDRIPTDLWCTGEVWQRLINHFGSPEQVRAGLHLDGFGGGGPRYVGPTLPAAPAGETVDYWGLRYKRMAYGTGEYQEQSFSPLAAAMTLDDLRAYRWPQVAWFDFSALPDQLRAQRGERAIQVGYMAPFYFHNLLRGLELSLTDPLLEPDFTHELVGRITDYFLAYHRRLFETCAGLIDVTQVTDDLGSQHGPLLSLETWRTFYREPTRRCIALAHEFGIKVMHHDDGAMSDFLPDLVELGIDILNPVQWTCPGMATGPLKARWGRQLCFHGGIENQRILPFGTPDEVRAEVRHCVDTLASDGTGYILAPCHNIQPVTPLANILAMYDEAHHYGARR